MINAPVRLKATEIPTGEPIPGRRLISTGWWPYDFPRTPTEQWKRFLAEIGEENYERLSETTYCDGTMRGVLLISPIGQQRIMREWLATTKERLTCGF